MARPESGSAVSCRRRGGRESTVGSSERGSTRPWRLRPEQTKHTDQAGRLLLRRRHEHLERVRGLPCMRGTRACRDPGASQEIANAARSRDALAAQRSYPEFGITPIIPTFRLSHLRPSRARFHLLSANSVGSVVGIISTMPATCLTGQFTGTGLVRAVVTAGFVRRDTQEPSESHAVRGVDAVGDRRPVRRRRSAIAALHAVTTLVPDGDYPDHFASSPNARAPLGLAVGITGKSG